jgi:hypothetical protein
MLPVLPGWKVNYQVLGIFPVLLIFFFRKNKKKSSFPLAPAIMLVALTFLFTLASPIVSDDYREVQVIGMIALIRWLFLGYIFCQVLTRETLKRVLVLILVLNLACSIIQVAYPQSISFFLEWYGRTSSVVLENILKRWGAFLRCTGTFGHPAEMGAFALFLFSVQYAEMMSADFSPKNALILGGAFVCGLFSTSKTFLLGFPIILFVHFFISNIGKLKNKRNKEKVSYFSKILLLLIAIFALSSTINLSLEKGFSKERYFEFLSKPFEAFAPRYDLNSGNLSATISSIKQHWFLGVGATRNEWEFVGDSLYVTVLYEAGIFGLAALFLLYFRGFKCSYAKREIAGFLALTVSLISNTGLSLLFSVHGLLPIAFALIPKDEKMTEKEVPFHSTNSSSVKLPNFILSRR